MTDQIEEVKNKVELTGKQKLCLSCQRCCKTVHIITPYAPDNQDIIEFYTIRGFKVYQVPIDAERKEIRLMLSIEHPCPFLTPAGCAIYGKRPKVCRDYDGRQDPFVNCAWKELPDEQKTS
jgi:Fe-S-cluster containining protein